MKKPPSVKASGQSDKKSPELDSCESCVHFHDETTAADEVRWGECWALPPAMLMRVVDDKDEPQSVNRTVQLPYVCGLFKPRLN